MESYNLVAAQPPNEVHARCHLLSRRNCNPCNISIVPRKPHFGLERTGVVSRRHCGGISLHVEAKRAGITHPAKCKKGRRGQGKRAGVLQSSNEELRSYNFSM